MSWQLLNPQWLARCSNCLVAGSAVAARSTARRPLGPTARLASSKAGVRPAKATAVAASEVSPVPKKKISTKSTTAAASKAATAAAKKKASTAPSPNPAGFPGTPVTAVKKTTRAASTKTASPVTPAAKPTPTGPATKAAAAPPPRKAATVAMPPTPIRKASTSSKPQVPGSNISKPQPTLNTKGQQAERATGDAGSKGEVGGKLNAGTSTQPRPSATTAPEGQHPMLPTSMKDKHFDVNSPAVKAAGNRWRNVMIAIPILLVTSYVLFDRCKWALFSPFWSFPPCLISADVGMCVVVLGNENSLEAYRRKVQGESARSKEA